MKIIKISAIWCPACIITNKYFKDVKKNFPNIEFIEYDLDFNEDEVKLYNVGNILPVIIFLDNENNEIKRIIGEKKQEEIEKEIRDVLNEEK